MHILSVGLVHDRSGIVPVVATTLLGRDWIPVLDRPDSCGRDEQEGTETILSSVRDQKEPLKPRASLVIFFASTFFVIFANWTSYF